MTLKQDYRLTNEAYKDAKKKGDLKLMNELSNQLIRIADAMERQ